ncbi:hypothetical protein [Dendronalium sp. ChiSLP03b]|uniref:hypothetical protein n=1 Tax=Dendronalium sp. ChiSLP03b TaxID=3075381 RepID=UPI00391B3617
MLKLPFKTSPKEFEKITVGNAEIGELEIPKYGDLTPNERIFIKAANLVDIRMAAVKLANAIAAKSGGKVTDIYYALTQGNAASLGEYLEDFVNFQDLMEENSKSRNSVLATAIIKRLVPEWELENTQDFNQIHPILVQEVADFARKEESGWQEVADEEITEEDLGNSPKNQEIPTGEKSTGDAEDTGRKKKDSAKQALAASQPG